MILFKLSDIGYGPWSMVSWIKIPRVALDKYISTILGIDFGGAEH